LGLSTDLGWSLRTIDQVFFTSNMEAEEAPGLDISQNGDGEYRSAVQVLALGVEEAITGSPSIRKILTRAKLRPELIDLRLQGEAFEDAQKDSSCNWGRHK